MARREGHLPAVRAASERSLGITQRCTPIFFAWIGDIRKRYTDFLVYEIGKDGVVIHLRDFEVDEEQEKLAQQFRLSNPRNATSVHTGRNGANNGANNGRNLITAGPNSNRNLPAAPQPELKTVSIADREALEALLGKTTAMKLIQLDENIQGKKNIPIDSRSVVFDPINDRSQRVVVHQEIRRVFESRIETVANSTGVITAMPSKPTVNSRQQNQGQGSRRNGNREQNKSFGQLGGEYLHFTVYKENKDTMDAVNTLARLLKIKATNFGFAGTKDRRAGTTQRISVFRQRANNLIWINSRLPNLKVGDFKYCKAPLQLGQHGGNEFIITLKNCQPLNPRPMTMADQLKMIQSSLETGLAYLQHRGYLNYFGLQRFGTYSIGTHLLGMKILKDQFESVISDILHVDEQYVVDILEHKVPQGNGPAAESNRDDFERARAITAWNMTKNAQKALEMLPKRFSSEAAIIQHLGKNPNDFMGAILSITRGMRMMYIHAYQSYVWNHVASERWSKYGNKVVVGDLVMVDGQDGKELSNFADDVELYQDSTEEGSFYAQAKPLTAEDVASGKYTIFDVVLPTPGYDVVYPQNDIGEFYVTFMGMEQNGALSPYDMRRKKKDFSLSGSYRHLLGRFISEPEFAIRLYSDDTEQMYPTDLDFCMHNKAMKRSQANQRSSASPAPRLSASPAPKATPTASRWADFSKNASYYDGLMDESRRRRATQSPPTDGTITMRDTWAQTGLDASSKRVKLARHQETVKETVETAETDSIGANVGGGGAPLVSPTKVAAKPASTSASPEKRSTPERDVPKVSVEDPHGWYGGLVPSAQAPTPTKSICELKASRHAPSAAKGPDDKTKVKETPVVTKIGKIVLPTFCKPSENPIHSSNDFSHELINNPSAKKIAVILKFQLKTSNYATVVLRELMGTTTEDQMRAI
ncbi:pseudouridine synthase [Echria macrotheca]|uniref:Pseudouridine synthase n=1 Tax=Echria macrotheca TaxID=438768 RepID=A0AAJ0F1S8_9PEZI|nr:pseudouridine synthase [Echria macrotheca]